MAQNIQLKRSALPGKVPDTGSLNLGELAVNTYDGKVFIKRSGSVESIQELVTTNTTNTGSITLTQTGSFGELVVTQDANIQNDLYVTNDIIGNGDIDVLGNITGSNLLIRGTLTAQSYIVSSSVINMTTQYASGSTIFGNTSDDTHKFTGSISISNGDFRIVDSGSNLFHISSGSTNINNGTVTITADSFASDYAEDYTDFGLALDVKGDTTITGSIALTGTLTSSLQEGYIWVGNSNDVSVLVPTSSITVSLPNGLVSGSSQLTSSYDVRYALSGTIGGEFYKKVETFTATAGQVTFTTAAIMSAGNVDVFVNGVKLLPDEFTVTSTNTLDLVNPSLAGESVDIEMFSAFGGTIGYFELTNIPNGLISGSQQLTSSYDTRYVISGSLGNASWDTLMSKPAGIVSGSDQLTSSYDDRYTLSGSITQTTWDNIASKPGGVVSGSSQLTASYDERYALSGSAGSTEFYKTSEIFTASAGQTSFTIGANATAGNVDVFINGTKLVETDFTIPTNHTITLVTGSIAGQIVNIETFSTYAVTTTAQGGGKIHTQSTAASTWTFAHNLGAQYPNVTVYNDSNQIIIPSSITANSTNLMTLEFGTPVAGYAAVSIGGVIDAEGKTSKQQFTSSLEWRFEHNLGDRFVAVQTFNDSYEMIIPQSITLTDVTSSTITFPSPVSGWAVGTIGGGLPAISSSYGGYYLRISETAPYTASWIPAVDITVANAETASHLNPISQSLVPAFSGTYDLGSVAKPWRHIYVGTGSIYLVDDKATITKTLTANTIVTTTDIASGSINLATSLPAGMVSHSAQVVHILNPVNAFTASNNIGSLNTYTSSLNNAIQLTGSTVSFLGNIIVYGTQSVINSQEIELKDNILYLAPTGSGDYDLGIVGHYNDGTYRHGGIFRDASDSGAWKVFKGLTTETSGAFVDTAGNGFELADFKAANLYGAVQATNGVVSGSTQIDLTATTNYETYINQAVKTTSSPTFTNITASSLGVSEVRVTSNQIYRNSSSEFYVNYSGTGNTILGNGTGNVSIAAGTNPSYRLHVSGTLGVTGNATFSSDITSSADISAGGANKARFKSDGTNTYVDAIPSNSAVIFRANGATEYARLTSLGFGIGITPQGVTNSKTLEIGSRGIIYDNNDNFLIGNNGWVDSSTWKYKQTGYAAILATNSGKFTFSTAASGTQNASITWNDRMLIENGGNVLPGANGTQDLGSSSYRWGGVYIGGLDASGNITTGANLTTSGDNVGISIKHGSNSAGYGRIRFYEGGTDNRHTIHSFSTSWGTSFSAQSRGALNLEGYNGVTFGDWNAPDMYVTRTSGNTYIKGTLTVGSTITENSSLRYKENVETIKYGLDKVLQMRGVTYDKKNTGVKNVGVIAEEIYEVLPEVVLKNEEGEIDSVSYGRITAVLIEAIKEQQKQIEELKSLINK